MRAAIHAFLFCFLAQQPQSFDVISVRRTAPDSKMPPIQVTNGGGFNANMTLDFLIQIAYKVKPFQIVNAPAWTHSDAYTINAKPPEGYVPKHPGLADDELARRIRALLEDRFQLVVRREPREIPAYVLTVAKNGPKLTPGDENEKFKLKLGRGKIANDGGGTIALLVSLLENQLDKRVFDETGLTGKYKFNLTYAPENVLDSPLPSLFTALQEQAGLKLESKRRPVDVIVIDKIERPTEN
jgi:uncharacterized protein (TIGR03435 family)